MNRLACILVVFVAAGGCLLSTGCMERFSQKSKETAHAADDGHGHADAADEHAGHDHGEPSAAEAEEAGHEGHDHAQGEAHDETADEHADEHGHAEHAAEEGGGGHEGHDHAELVSLTPEQLKEHGVKIATAGAGDLEQYLALPGEVAVNADKVGHVLPRLGGSVQKVTRNIGDQVKKGDLLVVIDSRELAMAKADYLSAAERVRAAQSVADREKRLFEKGVSPEQDYIAAKNAVAEAQITEVAARQSLQALGLSLNEISSISAEDASLTRYEIHAPVSGRILEKHVSIGEVVSSESELFLIADLSTVWVNLSVSQRDLPGIKEGQTVRIRLSPDPSKPDSQEKTEGKQEALTATGKIKYIEPLVSEDTRAATARVVLENKQGAWRPGMFVSGQLVIGTVKAKILVPIGAVIAFEGQQTVFVQDEHGFEPRSVTVGERSESHVEILTGLSAGESYVSEGAFTVKAEMGKSEASHGH